MSSDATAAKTPPSEEIKQLMAKAIALHQAGDVDAAEPLYLQAEAQLPDHPDIQHSLGLVAHQRGKHAEAISRIQTALKGHPDHPIYYSNLGLAQAALGELDAAIDSYRKALAIHPDFAQAYFHLGNALRAKGDAEEAMACYQNAFQLQPTHAEACYNLGMTLGELGRMEEAALCYQKAIGINPNYADAYGNLGNTFKALGRLQEAVQCYQRMIALLPNQAAVHSNLGSVLRDLGEVEGALEHHQKAVELAPDFAPAHNSLANTHKERGELEPAIAHYQQALTALMQGVPQQATAKAPMDTASAQAALRATKTALDAANIPFFLAFGTLLGIVRDGDLLPHDKDLDIGLAWDVSRKEAIAAMEADERFAKAFPGADGAEKDAWNITFVHTETGIEIDLFFFKPDGGDVLAGLYHRPTPLHWRFAAFETKEIDYLGAKWPAPAVPETFLEAIYGPEWQTPDVGFDSLLQGHNRNPEAENVAICFAYNRLFDRSYRGNWDRALCYAQAIATYQPHPVLEKVEEWLEQNITIRAALEQTASFWEQFYADKADAIAQPSPFATWCLEEQFAPETTLLELGCGNGRDSFAFLQAGHSVIAVDGCAPAIEKNTARENSGAVSHL